jgi:DNA recombination protein RmuC
MQSIALLVLGLLVGVALGWLAARARRQPVATGADPAMLAARHETAVAQLEGHHQAARAQLEQRHVEELGSLRAELAAADASNAGLQEAVEEARDRYRELVEQRRREAVEREQQQAGEHKVLQTIAPVAEQIKAMQLKVDEMEKQRVEQHGQLAEQLRHTNHTVEESKRAADSLASALSNNAVRGVWGETQLRTLVESAGLINHVDFDTQQSITAESGARRPDMVVNLPGGKRMAVDAKVPYNAFIDAHRTGIEPQERDRLLSDHARKVRGHVDALAGKSYWTGLDASPEFTVAYIPNDQLLAAALEADPSLMEYAFGRGIVLATPTNLWSILKTVAFTWRQDVLTEDAKQLFDLGRELYRRIVTMAEHADRLRRSIEGTVSNYNKFASSLESRVLVTARKLDTLDEEKVLGTAAHIEERPRQLLADDFSALAEFDRPELDLDLATLDAAVIDVDADEADAS